MKQTNERIKKYEQAVEYLPPRFRSDAMRLSDEEKENSCEFRLRAGRELSVYINGKEKLLTKAGEVRREELRTVLELATRSSVHTSQTSLRDGYVTVSGGHRIGICGTAIRDKSGITGFRDLSSATIRIAKEIKDAAAQIYMEAKAEKSFSNTLIISPPGHGKTTMLRDFIRRLSDSGMRLSVVDERGEIAAKYRGVPQFDVGRCTDVLDGIDKASGMMIMLKTMTPDVIALDEITAEADIDAIFSVVNCGVGIIATAHGESVESLLMRPMYRRLAENKVFGKFVFLEKAGSEFRYSMIEAGVLKL